MRASRVSSSQWLSRHRPQVLAKAKTAFHCKDWLYFKLSDERATDPSEGNFTFGDYATRQYSPGVLDDLGASAAKRLLPRIVEGTEEAGTLTALAAHETGLPEGLPVSLGYVDVICTGLGGGLFDPSGDTGCTIIGSTGMHMRLAATAGGYSSIPSAAATRCRSRSPACSRKCSPTWRRR